MVVNTGWHKEYADSQYYFGFAPGLTREAAEWLVDKNIGLFAIDTAAVDHPLATSLGLHRNGPLLRRLPKYYFDQTGRDPEKDFPEWNPAHRVLLGAGIPTEIAASNGLRYYDLTNVYGHGVPQWPSAPNLDNSHGEISR